MSYPKHPIGTDKEAQKDLKNNQRKEQLKSLLINKFRGKYQVTADNDQTDRVIRNEVETFILTQQMTEQNLIKLDQRLQEVLGIKSKPASNQQKRTQNASPAVLYRAPKQNLIDNDYGQKGGSSKRSTVSRQSFDAASRRSGSSFIQDAASQIIQNTPKKDDDHWNKIIKYNVESFAKEQEDAKTRVKENQNRMKDELELQIVQQKRIKEEEKKKEIAYMQQMKMVGEVKERQEKEKADQMKQKLLIEKQARDVQLMENQQKKVSEQKYDRKTEEERRRKLEKDAVDQEREKKLKIENYKKQCQRQMEENIQMKQAFKETSANEGKVDSSEDMLGPIFQEKKNIAMQKRIEIDKRVELIKDKMMGDQEARKLSSELQTSKILKERNEHLQKMEEKKRKEMKDKEVETKRFLDLQIQERQKRQDLAKKQDSHEAQLIENDVKLHQQQEQMKKQNIDKTKRVHQEGLQQQMSQPKNQGPAMAAHEFMINKQMLDLIDSSSGKPSPVKKPF